jgi:hypothetical protein
MNKKTLKALILYMSLCFAFLSINTSNCTTIKMNETLDGSITIYPVEPNGNFEWYVTPVYVTFHAEDDIRLAYINYKVTTEGQTDPNWTQVDIRNEYTAKYNLTIKISIDGIHTAIFYAVDHVGNIGSIHTSNWIQIDMSPPEVSLSKEKISFYEIKFTADATDITSGIHIVKFYVDDDTEPANEDTTFPYEFSWNGIGNHSITAKAYDFAGNEAITERSTPKSSDFSVNSQSESSLHFSFNQRGLMISDIGDVPVLDVWWNISNKGGLLLVGNRYINRTLTQLAPGESMTVKLGFMFGFGKMTFHIQAGATNVEPLDKYMTGTLVLSFILWFLN